MKKYYSFIFVLIVLFVLSSCKTNIENENINNLEQNNSNYINETITKDGLYDEAKELADKINEIESVEKQVDLNIETDESSYNGNSHNELANYKMAKLSNINNKTYDEDEYENITNDIFKVTNSNLITNSFSTIEDALRSAKNDERSCFQNHIGIINEWEYWYNESGEHDGQVRILYDKDIKKFTWERIMRPWDYYDELTDKNHFKNNGDFEYINYSTYLNDNEKLVIESIHVRYNDDTGIISYQEHFTYVEDDSFDMKEYVNENNTKSYLETHIGLNEDNKYFEEFFYLNEYNDNNKIQNYHCNIKFQHYFNDFIQDITYEDSNGDEYFNCRFYTYSLEELLSFQGMLDSDDFGLNINLNSIKGYNKILRYKHGYNTFKLFDSKNNIVNMEPYNLYCYPYNDDLYRVLLFSSKNSINNLDDWFIFNGLELKTSKKISLYYDTYLSEYNRISNIQFEKRISDFEVYDKKYIENAVKESDLPRFRKSNDLELEIEGEVILDDKLLDLSNLNITILNEIKQDYDESENDYFKEGKSYKFNCDLYLDNTDRKTFRITEPYECKNGKIIIDGLGENYLDNNFNLSENKMVSIMLEAIGPKSAFKLFIVDIMLEEQDGKIVGRPVPVDYNSCDWKK